MIKPKSLTVANVAIFGVSFIGAMYLFSLPANDFFMIPEGLMQLIRSVLM